MAGERIVSFPRVQHYVKYKQPRPGFELCSLDPFLATLTNYIKKSLIYIYIYIYEQGLDYREAEELY